MNLSNAELKIIWKLTVPGKLPHHFSTSNSDMAVVVFEQLKELWEGIPDHSM
jgi:hypothetical protein